ncbi:MAG: hypothetical protein HZB36_05820 [Candidatus Omnitrophica bacterium]|nr:hypothetical protein [Candidatus Omnitrophota bacterium]
MTKKQILENVEKKVSRLGVEEQRRFLCDLPRLLKIPLDDLLLLKAAEKSFDFWNNPEDKIYDRL